MTDHKISGKYDIAIRDGEAIATFPGGDRISLNLGDRLLTPAGPISFDGVKGNQVHLSTSKHTFAGISEKKDGLAGAHSRSERMSAGLFMMDDSTMKMMDDTHIIITDSISKEPLLLLTPENEANVTARIMRDVQTAIKSGKVGDLEALGFEREEARQHIARKTEVKIPGADGEKNTLAPPKFAPTLRMRDTALEDAKLQLEADWIAKTDEQRAEIAPWVGTTEAQRAENPEWKSKTDAQRLEITEWLKREDWIKGEEARKRAENTPANKGEKNKLSAEEIEQHNSFVNNGGGVGLVPNFNADLIRRLEKENAAGENAVGAIHMLDAGIIKEGALQQVGREDMGKLNGALEGAVRQFLTDPKNATVKDQLVQALDTDKKNGLSLDEVKAAYKASYAGTEYEYNKDHPVDQKQAMDVNDRHAVELHQLLSPPPTPQPQGGKEKNR